MSAVVVYESMFGSTRAVAEAVAAGLGDATLLEVGAFFGGPEHGALPADVTLLVVGAPTHAFGLSRPGTRKDAEAQFGPTISAIGVREWLDQLQVPQDLAVAAFGTKLASPLAGSAARGIAQRLRKLGGRLLLPAQDFFVPGTVGLDETLLDDARAWGAKVAAAAGARG